MTSNPDRKEGKSRIDAESHFFRRPQATEDRRNRRDLPPAPPCGLQTGKFV